MSQLSLLPLVKLEILSEVPGIATLVFLGNFAEMPVPRTQFIYIEF